MRLTRLAGLPTSLKIRYARMNVCLPSVADIEGSLDSSGYSLYWRRPLRQNGRWSMQHHMLRRLLTDALSFLTPPTIILESAVNRVVPCLSDCSAANSSGDTNSPAGSTRYEAKGMRCSAPGCVVTPRNSSRSLVVASCHASISTPLAPLPTADSRIMCPKVPPCFPASTERSVVRGDLPHPPEQQWGRHSVSHRSPPPICG